MTREQLISGNRSIALFLEWDKDNDFFEDSIQHSQFHSDYNWLMNAVHKIEDIGSYSVIINRANVSIRDYSKVEFGNDICFFGYRDEDDIQASNKKEAIYKCVLVFINKVYNQSI